MEERFAGAEWFVGMTGAPQLSDATVSFDCRVSEITDVGTHGVLFLCDCADHDPKASDGRVDLVRPSLSPLASSIFL